MHRPHRNLSIGLAVALFATGVATLLRLALAPIAGGGAPFTIQLVAVVVTAWFGGFWPGLAATLLGYFIGEDLFVHPFHYAAGPMSEAAPAALVRFFSYAIVGIAISFVSEQWHRVRLRDLARARRLEEEVGERLQAVEELRQSKQTLEALIAAAPTPIVVVEPDRTVRLWNLAAERVFGWTAAEVLGRDIPIVPAEKCAECEASRAAVSRGETVGPVATYRKRRDGERVYVELSAAPLYGLSGRVDSMVLLLNDVTERHRAEQSLRESQEMLREANRKKDVFLATLAHELRNPLAPIRNALQLMQLAGSDADTLERSRAMIGRQLTQMVRLVDDLLDVSRITSGKIELRNQIVSLQDVIRSAVETSQPLLDSMEHQLTISLPEEPIAMHADLTRLAQAFANILQNAAKYTDRGGRITLRGRRDGGRAVVTIADDGIGMSPELLQQVFGLFVQGNTSPGMSRGGLGVGLTIVKQLVEAHGGTVEARSAGAGQGSTFVVRLPVLERRPVPGDDGEVAGGSPSANALGPAAAIPGAIAAASRPVSVPAETSRVPAAAESRLAAAEPRPAATPSSARRRVLVVDDNADSVESLAALIRLMGHECATALGGEEAVDMARVYRPDTILLDIGMPGMNGFDACRAIRAEAWGKEMLLVAVTGWGLADDRERTRAAGFDLHLVKPVEPSILGDLLQERPVVETRA